MSNTEVLLSVENLTKRYRLKSKNIFQAREYFNAVDDVSFNINKKETLGLVGESGCGKTTLARCLVRILDTENGRVELYSNGTKINVLNPDPRQKRILSQNMQMVFQNPYASFNPRMKIEEIIREPLLIHEQKTYAEQLHLINKMLDLVGLQSRCLKRYPHEFSGGQLQRIAIARALVLSPALLICDEAVSALDVSIQAQIINLLKDLQAELGLTYLFIAHDLSVVEYISDRVLVMYAGKILELANSEILYKNPRHPYTEALLSAVPVADPHYKTTYIPVRQGPDKLPQGSCCFVNRCRYADERCFYEEPALVSVDSYDSLHYAACHYYDKLDLSGFDRRKK